MKGVLFISVARNRVKGSRLDPTRRKPVNARHGHFVPERGLRIESKRGEEFSALGVGVKCVQPEANHHLRRCCGALRPKENITSGNGAKTFNSGIEPVITSVSR